MLACVIALAVVQLAAPPAPSTAPVFVPHLGPAWVAAPLGKLQYAHYVRHEQDGANSEIFASRQVCDCQPDRAMQMLQAAIGAIPGASSHRETLTACGQPAYRMLATGIATPANAARNFEVVMFRFDNALYVLQYTFRYPTPMVDAENALLSLCASDQGVSVDLARPLI